MTEGSNTRSGPQSRGICVVMAGGRGTRFWPLSRKDRPKQFLALASAGSLLRDTFERLAPLVGSERILVVTSGDLAPLTRAELPELDPAHVVAEPIGRNTAPCAVLGLGMAARIDPQAPVALLPADHHIPDPDIFRAQLQAAFALAAARPTVVTFGIPPTRPETGYGYLRVEPAPAQGDPWRGLAFVEKPDLPTARGYVADGRHLWNSGIFVWNPQWFSACTRLYLQPVLDRLEPAVRAFGTDGFAAALKSAYEDCPAAPLDTAVMEKLDGFTVLPAAFRWSDLGSWDAWGSLAPALPGDNRGVGEVLALDGGDNVVMGGNRLIALLGVRDLVIVDTPDVLLVGRKDQAQRVKDIIAALERAGREDLL